MSHRPTSDPTEEERKTEEWTTVEQNASQKNSYTLKNLIGAAGYLLKMRCKNERGQYGMYSTLQKFTTSKKPDKPPPVLEWNTNDHNKAYSFPNGPSSFHKKQSGRYPWIVSTYTIKSSEWNVFRWEFSCICFSFFLSPFCIGAQF